MLTRLIAMIRLFNRLTSFDTAAMNVKIKWLAISH